jgi:hypothetical protein
MMHKWHMNSRWYTPDFYITITDIQEYAALQQQGVESKQNQSQVSIARRRQLASCLRLLTSQVFCTVYRGLEITGGGGRLGLYVGWTMPPVAFHVPSVGRDSSVGIATDYRLDGLGIKSRWRRDFPRLSRWALGSTQPPVQWVSGLSRG